MVFRLKFIASLLVLCGFSSEAEALVQYSDRSTFSIATGSDTFVDLNSPSFLKSFNSVPLVYSGLSFSVDSSGYNSDGNQLQSAGQSLGEYTIDGSQFAVVDLVGGATFKLTFGREITAFGASFAGFANAGRLEVISLIDANNDIVGKMSFNDLNEEFFEQRFIGFQSETPFVALSIFHNSSKINDVFGIDNIAFTKSAAPVPELATWAMMLVGFGMVAGAARYRRRSTTAVIA